MAPALVRPLPFLVPTYGHGLRGREALALGLLVNDLLSSDRNDGLPESERIPRSRMLSPAEVAEQLPGVPGRGLSGGALWTDAQLLSSERLLLALLHAASDAGAALANAVEVVGLARGGSRVTGAFVKDHVGGAELQLRARVVVNAAGPGAVGLLRRASLERPRVPLLRAWNFVLNRPLASSRAVGAKSGGRYLFLVPWRGRAIVGTDYESADGPGDPQRQERFLGEVQKAFPWAGVRAEDVALVHSGLVPGAGGADGLWSHSLIADHEAQDGLAGLVTVVGAKYTTARAVAEKAVDLASRRLGRPVAACRTAVTPLPKARLQEGPLEQQVVVAIRDEMALTLADVVMRRTELACAGPPAAADVDGVVAVMAREQGWSGERAQAERGGLEQALRAHAPRLLYNPR
jgi:glycerol-3-phosphate dehydrogenase